jgi:hypothetical protein
LTGFFPSADFAIATERSDLRLRVRINRFYWIFFFFYLSMQLGKILRTMILESAGDRDNASRALNGAHTAADAPIMIYPGFIFNHFYSLSWRRSMSSSAYG